MVVMGHFCAWVRHLVEFQGRFVSLGGLIPDPIFLFLGMEEKTFSDEKFFGLRSNQMRQRSSSVGFSSPSSLGFRVIF